MKAGETRQLELLSAERLQRENKMEVLAAHNELETAQLLLSRLVGSVETVEPKEDSLLPLDWKQASYNYSQTPDGQYSADRLKASEQAVRVAKNGLPHRSVFHYATSSSSVPGIPMTRTEAALTEATSWALRWEWASRSSMVPPVPR